MKLPDSVTEEELKWLNQSYVDLTILNETLHFKVYYTDAEYFKKGKSFYIADRYRLSNCGRRGGGTGWIWKVVLTKHFYHNYVAVP